MRRAVLGLMAGAGLLLLGACEDEPESIGAVPTLDSAEPPTTPKELVDRMVTAVAATGSVLHMTAELVLPGEGDGEQHYGSWEGWFDFKSLQGRLNYEKGPDNTTDTPEFEEYWFDEDERYRQEPDDDSPRLSDEAWRGCIDEEPLIAEVFVCGLASEPSNFELREPATIVTGEWHGLAAVGIAYAWEQVLAPSPGDRPTPSPTAGAGTPTAVPPAGTIVARTEYEFFVDRSTYFPLGLRVTSFRDGLETGTYEFAYKTDLIKRDDFDTDLLDPRAAGYQTEDEAEMEFLDHPEGNGPVYWLGREFDGGDSVGVLVLDGVDQRYNAERPTLLTLYYEGADGNGRLELEMWTPEGWDDFTALLEEADNNSGHWPFGEACRDVEAFEAGDFQGSIIAGYDYDRPEIGGAVATTPGVTAPTATPFPSQPCPERAQDEFMAVIEVEDGYVVTLNASVGIFELGEAYEAVRQPRSAAGDCRGATAAKGWGVGPYPLDELDGLGFVALRVAAEFDEVVELDDAVADAAGITEGIELLHAADVAGAVVTVTNRVAGEDVLPLAAKVGLGNAAIDVVPGQGLAGVPFAVGVPGGVDAQLGEGLLPTRGIEVFAPGIEAGAQLPGVVDSLGDAAVATAEDGLEEGVFGIVPAEFDAGLAAAVLEQVVLGGELGCGLLAGPLEGRVGLGDEVAGADADAGAATHVALADLLHLAAKVDDALRRPRRSRWAGRP